MDNLGKVIQVLYAEKVDNIKYKHRVDKNRFLSALIVSSILMCLVFISVNIFRICKIAGAI